MTSSEIYKILHVHISRELLGTHLAQCKQMAGGDKSGMSKTSGIKRTLDNDIQHLRLTKIFNGL